MTDSIMVSRAGPVATVALDRPGKLNALTKSMRPAPGEMLTAICDPRPLTAAEADERFDCFGIGDFRTGCAAFPAKRKPEFRGK
jgi:hypothetical protein